MIKKLTFSLTLLTTFFLLFIIFSAVFSQTTLTFAADTTKYQPLAPIPLPGIDTANTDLIPYLKTIFLVGVALSGAFAVLMIILGGLQYMSTDAISPKSDGKARIQNALFGLLLVMIAWLVLNTINPALVNLNLNVPNIPTKNPTASSTAPITKPAQKRLNVHLYPGNYLVKIDGPFDAKECEAKKDYWRNGYLGKEILSADACYPENNYYCSNYAIYLIREDVKGQKVSGKILINGQERFCHGPDKGKTAEFLCNEHKGKINNDHALEFTSYNYTTSDQCFD